MNPVRNSSRCDSKPSGGSNPALRGGTPYGAEPRVILESDPDTGQRASISNGVNRWERVDATIDWVEQTLIVTFLSFMISIAFLQIVLRNFFFTGLDWGDSLLRNLVLWIGFIGATLATREGKHINIDVVSRWLPPLGKNVVTLITHLFSFLICCGLTYAALKFIKNEVQMGTKTFLNLPAWVPEMILPMTFGLMTFRFGLRSFKNLSEMEKVDSLRDREKET